jgi:hypothetical protein
MADKYSIVIRKFNHRSYIPYKGRCPPILGDIQFGILANIVCANLASKKVGEVPLNLQNRVCLLELLNTFPEDKVITELYEFTNGIVGQAFVLVDIDPSFVDLPESDLKNQLVSLLSENHAKYSKVGLRIEKW